MMEPMAIVRAGDAVLIQAIDEKRHQQRTGLGGTHGAEIQDRIAFEQLGVRDVLSGAENLSENTGNQHGKPAVQGAFVIAAHFALQAVLLDDIRQLGQKILEGGKGVLDGRAENAVRQIPSA